MKKLVIVVPVVAALAAPGLAHADYQAAIHVGRQTFYLAVDAGATNAFRLRRPRALVEHRSYDRSAMALSGTVRDPNTNPIGGLPITAQVGDLFGQTWTTVATGTTSAAGFFVVRVPAGDSRLVRLWAGASYLTFKELVSPTLRLHVRALSGHRLRFSGRIRIAWAGDPPVVEIDSRTPTRWATLAAVKVNSFGTFRYTYVSALPTVGYRFLFRLATLSTPEWSWAASPLASATVR